MASRVQHLRDRAVEAKWEARIKQACAAVELSLYADSVTVWGELAFALVRRGGDKLLLLLSENESLLGDFSGERCDVPSLADDAWARLSPLTTDNAQSLRNHVPLLMPIVPGRGPSFGTGDRLGIATPGHIQALRGSGMLPVLAQQSIRELSRTKRAPRDVMDDALWGALQAGYRGGYAADADHLKTVSHINAMLDAGFTMYTVDPGDLIDNTAAQAEDSACAARTAELPWDALESTADDCRRRYAGRRVTVTGRHGSFRFELTAYDVLRAAAKYGRALAHTVSLYRHLVSQCPRERFAFEIAVDETDTPTTAAEHFFVASELQRLGVRWESLAPRFVGSFFKGVDYVGNLEEFRSEFRKHVLIAEHCGGYKLSLHSGSDKFSLYPIVAELAGDAIHIKTSGTSYLEALRVVAKAAPAFFREIIAFAKQRYSQEAADYRVGTDLTKVVDLDQLRDDDLPLVLDQPDTRQVCHVTYGAVLTSRGPDGRLLLRGRLMSVLRENERVYHRRLEEHFQRHISSFV
jgi:hypothetical protein